MKERHKEKRMGKKLAYVEITDALELLNDRKEEINDKKESFTRGNLQIFWSHKKKDDGKTINNESLHFNGHKKSLKNIKLYSF